jgi:beta-glucosidase
LYCGREFAICSIIFVCLFVKTISPDLDEHDLRIAAALGREFRLGAATSSYQIEGAVNVDGRGPSIWDTFSHTPGKTVNGETGDVACDHYARWKADVDLMAEMGLEAYRFSMAWSRVQPLGEGAWNQAGLDFYDRLADRLLANGIEPHVTLYHWDLPQALQDKGGWANRDTAHRFADYAAKIATVLGDRAKTISTHNEPFCTAVLGHEIGKFAPGATSPKLATQVAHHLLLSHGLAMGAMRACEPRAALGIVLNQSPATAASADPADIARARTEYAKLVQWYMDPVLLGRYPTDVGIEHYPEIRDGDMALISAPIDFLGLNYYTRIWASTTKPDLAPPCALGKTDMGWEIFPEGLEQLLVAHQKNYTLPPIYIMENGTAVADRIHDGQVNDEARVDYVRRHLDAVANARAAGVDIRGYFYWSLFDNYEWDSGYAKRFGLVYVDYATQQRTIKQSGLWYRSLIESKAMQANAQIKRA